MFLFVWFASSFLISDVLVSDFLIPSCWFWFGGFWFLVPWLFGVVVCVLFLGVWFSDSLGLAVRFLVVWCLVAGVWFLAL